ncbi:pilus assembly protein [Branchiibius sp. NY16-3462-2]|uniref:pilus assembly protein n=1 Tax=Branchiibius sp. NY16-3462-2 TaxID=1807500 RepID=UPI00079B26F7|nr:pilus assembly protein [Branchiibius sp. NY16-3462-2]KYH45911.1 pilus assembly protein TadE [Branchiibius sp. NY16-3462-2]
MNALRRRLGGAEDGSAVIEFLVVGILLALPVFYLVITLARLQAGTYAVTAAARESARTFVAADNAAMANQRASAAARLAFQDQGFGNQGKLTARCGGACLTRGSTVTTRADLAVDLPLIPDFLRGVVPSSISVSATHTEAVDRFKR